MKKVFSILCGIILIIPFTTAQDKAIGSWTAHLSYEEGTSITSDGKKVFCGTTAGYFIYNTEDNSIETKSKVDGLSEVSIKKIKYIPSNKKLLIVYDNGNIDLIHQNKITTIPFIKESGQVSGKNANDIYVKDHIAYIAFDFGIIVFDTDVHEIKETYQVAATNSKKRIQNSAVKGDFIYVGTNKGIYKGKLQENLIDFSKWKLISTHSDKNIKKMLYFSDEIYTVVEFADKDSLYKIDENNQFHPVNALPEHIYSSALVNKDELIYVSNDTNYIFNENFMVVKSFKATENSDVIEMAVAQNHIFRINRYTPVRMWNRNGDIVKFIRPTGPSSNEVFDMDAAHGELWTVNGGYDFALNNLYKSIKINRYTLGYWLNYSSINASELNGMYDAVSVNIHPREKDKVYISTWSKGLLEFNNNLPFKRYDTTNSSLIFRKALEGWLGVSDAKIDEEGNLWVLNTMVPSCISVKKPNGEWKRFDFSPEIEHENRMVNLEITSGGHVWVSLNRRNEILVFDYNNTINNTSDDRYIILTTQKGFGNLPGTRGIVFKEDKTGQMWVGTSAGLVVHYNPDRVFESEYRDLEEILIDDGENIEVLLKGASINAIAIDGANNKWIGTENSGVYQLSADGKKQLAHFTFNNSPLISNQIISIAIDDLSGEVYFGTAKGIVSYKSSIIAAKDNLHELKIYPNPVKKDYSGPIGISGLMDKSRIKITDIHGNLVNEFQSEGGQVVWYGDKMDGQKVSSGVYIIMSSAEDKFGVLNTKIGKVLFLK